MTRNRLRKNTAIRPQMRRRGSGARLAEDVRRNPRMRAFSSTLRRTSYDDAHRQYLSNSPLEAYNFDDIKTKYLNGLGLSNVKLSSVDAVCVRGRYVYLIEFKNGKQDNVKAHAVKKKVADSLLILSELTGYQCSTMRPFLRFVYVINSREHIGESLTRLAGGGKSARVGKSSEMQNDEIARAYEGVFLDEGLVLTGTKFDAFMEGERAL